MRGQGRGADLVTIPRSLLAQAFPNNPRLRAELEAQVDLIDSITEEAATLKANLDSLAAELGTGSFQPASEVLTEISGVPNKVGALELKADGQADVRAIDGSDTASLLTRGNGYATFLALGGRGPTGSRPTPSSGVAIIYFDTTLAAGGKPIFNYGNTGWVDATGASV